MPSGDNILRLNRDAIAKAGLPPIGREGVTLLRVNEKYQRPAEHANMNLSAAIADGWAGSTTRCASCSPRRASETPPPAPQPHTGGPHRRRAAAPSWPTICGALASTSLSIRAPSSMASPAA
eukprot:2483783-Prymnesium_polylepis.2